MSFIFERRKGVNTPCLFSNLAWFNAAIKTIWSYIYWKSRTRAYTFTAHLKDTQNDAWKALKWSNFDDRCYLFPIYWIKKREKIFNKYVNAICVRIFTLPSQPPRFSLFSHFFMISTDKWLRWRISIYFLKRKVFYVLKEVPVTICRNLNANRSWKN